MAELSSPLARLAAFRAELHACCTRRTDALLELGDALLCAPAIPSIAHLSLEPIHRRGWGSAYAALARGRIDAEELRALLARHPLEDGGLPIYAVDATTWARCDANCSPERGLDYHPRGTRPASRSWPAGPTSGSPSSASSRQLDRAGGRPPPAPARQPQPGRRRPDPRAACAPAHQRAGAAVRVRRRLRPDRPGIGAGRGARRDPGAAALRALLLRRPATTGGDRQGRPATPPRRQAGHQRPGHLAGADDKPRKGR
jgi:hypothetical protein